MDLANLKHHTYITPREIARGTVNFPPHWRSTKTIAFMKNMAIIETNENIIRNKTTCLIKESCLLNEIYKRNLKKSILIPKNILEDLKKLNAVK